MARTALAQYIVDRLAEQRETAEEFADRIGINSSGLYKLLRGEYMEPRQATLDKIAAGFGMTPADLLIAIGKGSTVSDPDEIELLADYRQVSLDQRTTIKQMVRGLRASIHSRESAKASRGPVTPAPNPDENGSHDTPKSRLYELRPALAFG